MLFGSLCASVSVHLMSFGLGYEEKKGFCQSNYFLTVVVMVAGCLLDAHFCNDC